MLPKPVQECTEMFAASGMGLRDLRCLDDVPVRQVRGEEPEHGSGAVLAGKPLRPVVEEPRVNAGAVVGQKAIPDSLVRRRQGNVRQGKPDNEVTAKGLEPADRGTCISPLLQDVQELRHEASSGLDLRRRFRVPDLEQMPEEPDRKRPAPRTGCPADLVPTRAAAFMAHETVEKADVERVETLPAECQPDRDVAGCPDKCVSRPDRNAKALQMLSVASDNTGIPLRNPIGQWWIVSLGRHDLSPVSVKADRSGADFYGNLIRARGMS